MTVGRIGPFEPIQPGREGGRSGRIEKKAVGGDSVAISKDTIKAAETRRLIDMVRDVPGGDVRTARIAELRQKINDPAYINDAVMNAVADDIMRGLRRGSGPLVSSS